MMQKVINWHILEKCNFDCKYCFAHWGETKNSPSSEIWQNSQKSEELLKQLSLIPNSNPDYREWRDIRLNIAGGEPLLLWHRGKLPEIMEKAKNLEFKLSIISNGFLLTDMIIEELAPKLQVLGISMDSTNTETNKKIGRCGKSNQQQQIDSNRVAEIFNLARSINPDIECKLNTVVNSYNWQEDMNDAVKTIQPDRWKLFKMLPIADTDSIFKLQQPLKITDKQFEKFRIRHKELPIPIFWEDNDDMTESYLMIDPHGRFYQNKSGVIDHKHIFSEPIHEVGIERAIGQIPFSNKKFERRYNIKEIK